MPSMRSKFRNLSDESNPAYNNKPEKEAVHDTMKFFRERGSYKKVVKDLGSRTNAGVEAYRATQANIGQRSRGKYVDGINNLAKKMNLDPAMKANEQVVFGNKPLQAGESGKYFEKSGTTALKHKTGDNYAILKHERQHETDLNKDIPKSWSRKEKGQERGMRLLHREKAHDRGDYGVTGQFTGNKTLFNKAQKYPITDVHASSLARHHSKPGLWEKQEYKRLQDRSKFETNNPELKQFMSNDKVPKGRNFTPAIGFDADHTAAQKEAESPAKMPKRKGRR